MTIMFKRTKQLIRDSDPKSAPRRVPSCWNFSAHRQPRGYKREKEAARKSATYPDAATRKCIPGLSTLAAAQGASWVAAVLMWGHTWLPSR